MTVQCKCGRFLAHPRVFTDGWGERLEDVRGDCSRCGSDVEAGTGEWWSWDAWKWPDDERTQS